MQLAVAGRVWELDADESLTVFRLVQEALTNVTKHAEASLVGISLRYEKTCLRVQIDDDGKGFDVEGGVRAFALNGKLGLLGMKERAQAIGGSLCITSVKGVGTSVGIVINRREHGGLVSPTGSKDARSLHVEEVAALLRPR